MEFKLRANYIMSKNITVEADNLKDAIDKANALMTEPIPYKELTMRQLYFDEISPFK